MPALIRYRVELTQAVIVSATSPEDAGAMGVRAICGEKKPEDQLNISSDIKKVYLSVGED